MSEGSVFLREAGRAATGSRRQAPRPPFRRQRMTTYTSVSAKMPITSVTVAAYFARTTENDDPIAARDLLLERCRRLVERKAMRGQRGKLDAAALASCAGIASSLVILRPKPLASGPHHPSGSVIVLSLFIPDDCAARCGCTH